MSEWRGDVGPCVTCTEVAKLDPAPLRDPANGKAKAREKQEAHFERMTQRSRKKSGVPRSTQAGKASDWERVGSLKMKLGAHRRLDHALEKERTLGIPHQLRRHGGKVGAALPIPWNLIHA